MLAEEELSLTARLCLSVTLCPTQLATALIRLTLISRIVQLLQTLKCIQLLICSASQGLWAGCLIRIGSYPLPFCNRKPLQCPWPLVCLCMSVCVYVCLHAVDVCAVFRAQRPTQSVVGRMETGQGPSICVHTSKASVLYLRTSITAFSTPATEDTA